MSTLTLLAKDTGNLVKSIFKLCVKMVVALVAYFLVDWVFGKLFTPWSTEPYYINKYSMGQRDALHIHTYLKGLMPHLDNQFFCFLLLVAVVLGHIFLAWRNAKIESGELED